MAIAGGLDDRVQHIRTGFGNLITTQKASQITDKQSGALLLGRENTFLTGGSLWIPDEEGLVRIAGSMSELVLTQEPGALDHILTDVEFPDINGWAEYMANPNEQGTVIVDYRELPKDQLFAHVLASLYRSPNGAVADGAVGVQLNDDHALLVPPIWRRATEEDPRYLSHLFLAHAHSLTDDLYAVNGVRVERGGVVGISALDGVHRDAAEYTAQTLGTNVGDVIRGLILENSTRIQETPEERAARLATTREAQPALYSEDEHGNGAEESLEDFWADMGMGEPTDTTSQKTYLSLDEDAGVIRFDQNAFFSLLDQELQGKHDKEIGTVLAGLLRESGIEGMPETTFVAGGVELYSMKGERHVTGMFSPTGAYTLGLSHLIQTGADISFGEEHPLPTGRELQKFLVGMLKAHYQEGKRPAAGVTALEIPTVMGEIQEGGNATVLKKGFTQRDANGFYEGDDRFEADSNDYVERVFAYSGNHAVLLKNLATDTTLCDEAELTQFVERLQPYLERYEASIHEVGRADTTRLKRVLGSQTSRISRAELDQTMASVTSQETKVYTDEELALTSEAAVDADSLLSRRMVVRGDPLATFEHMVKKLYNVNALVAPKEENPETFNPMDLAQLFIADYATQTSEGVVVGFTGDIRRKVWRAITQPDGTDNYTMEQDVQGTYYFDLNGAQSALEKVVDSKGNPIPGVLGLRVLGRKGADQTDQMKGSFADCVREKGKPKYTEVVDVELEHQENDLTLHQGEKEVHIPASYFEKQRVGHQVAIESDQPMHSGDGKIEHMGIALQEQYDGLHLGLDRWLIDLENLNVKFWGDQGRREAVLKVMKQRLSESITSVASRVTAVDRALQLPLSGTPQELSDRIIASERNYALPTDVREQGRTRNLSTVASYVFTIAGVDGSWLGPELGEGANNYRDQRFALGDALGWGKGVAEEDKSRVYAERTLEVNQAVLHLAMQYLKEQQGGLIRKGDLFVYNGDDVLGHPHALGTGIGYFIMSGKSYEIERDLPKVSAGLQRYINEHLKVEGAENTEQGNIGVSLVLRKLDDATDLHGRGSLLEQAAQRKHEQLMDVPDELGKTGQRHNKIYYANKPVRKSR